MPTYLVITAYPHEKSSHSLRMDPVTRMRMTQLGQKHGETKNMAQMRQRHEKHWGSPTSFRKLGKKN